MTDKTPILKAFDIHREFETIDNHLPVLKGVNFTLNSRETASVTGASGVGKSTLLHILGGLDKPSKGEVEIDNQPLKSMSEKELAKFRNDKIGFVFQFHYLMEDFSALENLMIPMLVAGKSKKEAKDAGERLLKQVGLIDRASHRPAQLSGGEQQRIAVARALANKPKLVLADEPSGNLDTTTGRKLHDLLLSLNEEYDVALLIATHNAELSKQCHRRFDIKDGIIIENS